MYIPGQAVTIVIISEMGRDGNCNLSTLLDEDEVDDENEDDEYGVVVKEEQEEDEEEGNEYSGDSSDVDV